MEGAEALGPVRLPGAGLTRTFEYPWTYHAVPIHHGLTAVDIGGGFSGFQFLLDRHGVAEERAPHIRFELPPEALHRSCPGMCLPVLGGSARNGSSDIFAAYQIQYRHIGGKSGPPRLSVPMGGPEGDPACCSAASIPAFRGMVPRLQADPPPQRWTSGRIPWISRTGFSVRPGDSAGGSGGSPRLRHDTPGRNR